MSVVALSKALRDCLNSDVGEFSKPFEAVRGHQPVDEADKLTESIRLLIAPGAMTQEVSTRRTTLSQPSIFICVLCRLSGCTSTDDKGDLTELDEMVEFVEELQRYFIDEHGDPGTVSDDRHQWTVTAVAADPVYDPAALAKGIFQSVIKVDFEATVGA